MQKDVLALIIKLAYCTHAISNYLDHLLAPAGLTFQQYKIVSALQDTPSWNNDPMITKKEAKPSDLAGAVTQVSLAKHLNLDVTTICRGISILRKRGVVTATRPPANQRITLVQLTPHGAELFAQANELLGIWAEKLQISGKLEKSVASLQDWAALITKQ